MAAGGAPTGGSLVEAADGPWRVPLARMQYLEAVDAATLAPVGALAPGDRVLVAAAVYFGKTRLIDNVSLRGALTGGSRGRAA